MVLIFLGVVIICNVSSLEFHQVKSARLHCQWWVAPSSSDLSHWIIRLRVNSESYNKLQLKPKSSSQV